MSAEPQPDEAAEESDEGEDVRKPAFNLLEAIGGRHGIADSSLPGLAFVIAYTASGQSLSTAIWAAIAVGALLFAVRAVRRETIQFAVVGFVGVAIAAFIAKQTGKAENFFLPGLLLNIAYGAAYAVSIVVRWPLVGVIVGPLVGEGMEWRKDPKLVRVYSQASWIWVGMFAVRLAVQLPLYFAGELVALGVAKTAMGFPIFALTIWLSYLVLRKEIDLRSYPGSR
ncbi:DUF3159 domain-containing protein [soil metagenome]